MEVALDWRMRFVLEVDGHPSEYMNWIYDPASRLTCVIMDSEGLAKDVFEASDTTPQRSTPPNIPFVEKLLVSKAPDKSNSRYVPKQDLNKESRSKHLNVSSRCWYYLI